MKKTTQSGFTLYELLTTVLVIGVILALGVPNMTAFRQNSTMTALANDLHSSFHLARSEASRSRAIVTICSSTNSMTANPSCGGEFEDGWIVFADTDGDIAVDGGEAILRRFPAANTDIAINSGGNDDYFSYAASGQGRGNVTGNAPVGTLVMCDGRGNITGPGGRSAARVLVVTPLGRPTVLRDVAQVTFHGGC
ncbi:MAG: GspH/FimT family pseudopilin [Pseudomonadota bacterium]